MTMIHQQLAVAAQGTGREYAMVAGGVATTWGYNDGLGFGSLTPDDWRGAFIAIIQTSTDRLQVILNGAGNGGAGYFDQMVIAGSGLQETMRSADATYGYNSVTDSMTWEWFAPAWDGWQFADGQSYTVTIEGPVG